MNTLETLTTQAFFGLDVAFVIDSTGSMTSYINGAKESVRDIIERSKCQFLKCRADINLLRFGIVAYRDHPPQESSWLTKIQDFTHSTQAEEFLNKLNADGGGDPPEAALDGLHDAIEKLSWSENSDKMLFLLLDNSAHGIRFGTRYDCPCNYHEKDILPKMKKMNISFHIVKPNDKNSQLEKMVEVFKEYIEIQVTELERFRQIRNRDHEDLEMKIFSRGRTFERRKRAKSNSRSKSRSRKRKSRSRSRDSLDMSISPIKKKVSPTDSPGLTIKKERSNTMIVDRSETDIKKGVKQTISKYVIDKLEKYLTLDDDVK